MISDYLTMEDKIDILIEIKEEIGEQKIDMVLTKNSAMDTDPFIKAVRDQLKEII